MQRQGVICWVSKMTYSDHFKSADQLIQHLDPILENARNPFIEFRYTGFLAVSSVTVLELAMKQVFLEFSEATNEVLKNFCEEYFDRINGKIDLDSIRKKYAKKFGKKYQDEFDKKLEVIECKVLEKDRVSMRAMYGNLITWRHAFVHEGVMPQNATYSEVKRAYGYGKMVMGCLSEAMHS